jgi:predicted nuclease with TOPRIM domain
MELQHITPETLAADIAAALVKTTATTTARDLEINTLQINFKTMFEQNAKEHEETRKALETMTDKLEQLIDKMDKRYAPMWTRDVMLWGGGILGTSLILYVINRLFLR